MIDTCVQSVKISALLKIEIKEVIHVGRVLDVVSNFPDIDFDKYSEIVFAPGIFEFCMGNYFRQNTLYENELVKFYNELLDCKIIAILRNSDKASISSAQIDWGRNEERNDKFFKVIKREKAKEKFDVSCQEEWNRIIKLFLESDINADMKTSDIIVSEEAVSEEGIVDFVCNEILHKKNLKNDENGEFFPGEFSLLSIVTLDMGNNPYRSIDVARYFATDFTHYLEYHKIKINQAKLDSDYFNWFLYEGAKDAFSSDFTYKYIFDQIKKDRKGE